MLLGRSETIGTNSKTPCTPINNEIAGSINEGGRGPLLTGCGNSSSGGWVGEWVRNWGLDMAPELGILGIYVFVTNRVAVRDLGAFVPGNCIVF